MLKVYRICFWVVTLLIACAARAEAAGPWGEDNPLVVVHSTQTPPMAYIGFNGEQKGMIVDYWHLWSRVNHVPVKLVLVDWAESLRMVREGRADVHGGLFFSEDRAQFLDFAPPYFELDAALAVRASLAVHSIAELGDHAVGVLASGYSNSFVRANYPGLNRREYSTMAALAQGAVSGEVDAMIIERVTLVHLLGEMGRLNEFRMPEVLYTQPLRPAVAKGNTEVLALVEQGMRAIPAKDLDRVFRRWTIPVVSGPSWLLGLLGMGVAVAAGILGLVLLQGRRRR